MWFTLGGHSSNIHNKCLMEVCCLDFNVCLCALVCNDNQSQSLLCICIYIRICVYTRASKSVREPVCGDDKHLSPEAAFRFPLTSSVKSAQSLHCHLPATRERPALHTDKLICLVLCTHMHAHTHEHVHAHLCPPGFPLSPKIEFK